MRNITRRERGILSGRGILRGTGIGTIILLTLSFNAYGGEYPHAYRGARTLGMGGAYIATADDDNVLFLNPAGLGSGKVKSLDIVNIQVEVPLSVLEIGQDALDIAQSSSATTQQNEAVNLFDEHMGDPIGLGFSQYINIIFKYFGLGVFFKIDPAMRITDPVMPRFGGQIHATAGAAIGGGYHLLDRRLMFGVVGKGFARGVAKESYSLARLSRAAGAAEEEGGGFSLPEMVRPEIKSELFVNADIGLIYRFFGKEAKDIEFYEEEGLKPKIRKLNPTMGLTVRDINIYENQQIVEDIASVTEDILTVKQSPEALYPLTVSLGAAIHPKLGPTDLNVGLDFEDIFFNAMNDSSVLKRMHLGVEWDIIDRWFFGFALRAGLNQISPTVGLSLNLLSLLELEVATYGEELGVEPGQFTMRRFVVRISI